VLNEKGKILCLSLPKEFSLSGFQEVMEMQIVGDTERHSASAGVQAHTDLSVKLIYSVLTK